MIEVVHPCNCDKRRPNKEERLKAIQDARNDPRPYRMTNVIGFKGEPMPARNLGGGWVETMSSPEMIDKMNEMAAEILRLKQRLEIYGEE